MSEAGKLREAEAAARAALRSHPGIRELEPERGFHACFEVPVTVREVLAHGIGVSHVPGAGEAGRMDAEGEFRVLVGLVLREDAGGQLGVSTGVDLEFLARRASGGAPEWLSATRIRDPESGEWAQTAEPAAVQRLLHDACPGWAEVVRAAVVRLAAARRSATADS
ncbi:MAG TPA: hypothetical protein VHG51_20485 [Longimicrobiaceae bacterium]|nr:hypothetical protein [Longimicrobiaceae bacterium]